MNNITRHTGKLEILKRLPSSINGNPRFLVSIDNWSAKTIIDSSEGYSITNYEGKLVNAEIGTHYGSAHIQNITAI